MTLRGIGRFSGNEWAGSGRVDGPASRRSTTPAIAYLPVVRSAAWPASCPRHPLTPYRCIRADVPTRILLADMPLPPGMRLLQIVRFTAT